MPPSGPLLPAADMLAQLPRHHIDFRLKPPRDPHPCMRAQGQGTDASAVARRVPSSPLARTVMTFRSSSPLGDSIGASKSPLHRIPQNNISRKKAVSAKPNHRHVHFEDMVHISAPRQRMGQRPRAKYQSSPTMSTPTGSASKAVSRTAQMGADIRPVYKCKVLEKPKSQPIFKKVLTHPLIDVMDKCQFGRTKATVTQPSTGAVPIPFEPVTASQVPAPTASTTNVPRDSKPRMSHQPDQLDSQSKLGALEPPVPTPAALRKQAFVATWVASQGPFATMRADRLLRGIPPPNASGTGYLVHSPLPFAPSMDHLPQIESDVWSAGDLVDMKTEVRPITAGLPSYQGNGHPNVPVVRMDTKEPKHATTTKYMLVRSIAKEVVPIVQEVDMDEGATLASDGVVCGTGNDDASSQSSERTMVPQGNERLCSLPGSASSKKHLTSPPKPLARQDSAILFVAKDDATSKVARESPHMFSISLDCQERPRPLGWAVVPCSDLSMNGLVDEFLAV